VSVFLRFSITTRPFASRPDPGFPLGLWAVHVSTLGDGSAGLLTTAPTFQRTGQPGNTLLYSLEQLGLATSLAGGIGVDLNLENFDDLPLNGSTGAVSDVYPFTLIDDGIFTGSSMPLKEGLFKPFFLGAPRQNALNASLNFAMANTAVSLSVKAQGYYWSPGAINAVGGPQRPPGSIYGL